jgi:hypothetical protein
MKPETFEAAYALQLEIQRMDKVLAGALGTDNTPQLSIDHARSDQYFGVAQHRNNKTFAPELQEQIDDALESCVEVIRAKIKKHRAKLQRKFDKLSDADFEKKEDPA